MGVNAVVAEMANQGLPARETKSLSFTDNRQDASLQAGHLNDFVQVALLPRWGSGGDPAQWNLDFRPAGTGRLDALELRPSDFLRDPRRQRPRL